MSPPDPEDAPPPAPRPRLSARGQQAAAERFERAAAALRANLKRRKAQLRARAAGPDADRQAGPAAPAGREPPRD